MLPMIRERDRDRSVFEAEDLVGLRGLDRRVMGEGREGVETRACGIMIVTVMGLLLWQRFDTA